MPSVETVTLCPVLAMLETITEEPDMWAEEAVTIEGEPLADVDTSGPVEVELLAEYVKVPDCDCDAVEGVGKTETPLAVVSVERVGAELVAAPAGEV